MVDEVERLLLLVEAAGKLLGSPRVDAVLPAVLEAAQGILAADAYALWQRDLDNDVWRLELAAGLSREYQLSATAAVAQAPRAVEMMTALGHTPATEFPCLVDAVTNSNSNGGGAALADAATRKTAVKCQAAIGKAALGFAAGAAKTIHKCADDATTCVQKTDTADRDACAAMLEAAADLQKIGHGAARGVQAESRASGENESVDALHRHFRLEQRRVAQRRRPSVHRNRCDHRLLKHDHSDA